MATVLAVAHGLVATPIPTPSALQSEQADVERVTRDDFDQLKSGLKTNADLAELLEGRASKFAFGPARYLLLRNAFRQWVLAGEVAPIVKAFDRIVETDGCEYAYSIARTMAVQIGRLAVSKKPGAQEFHHRLSRLERQLARIAKLRKQTEALTEDPQVHRRLASAYAGIGDWAIALEEYAKCGQKVKEILDFERTYPRTGITELSTADIAEFWWHEAEMNADGEKEAVGQFRQRAVKWYRFAIENGTLVDAKRKIAEKRVAEQKWRAEVEETKKNATTKPSAAVAAGASPKEEDVKVPASTPPSENPSRPNASLTATPVPSTKNAAPSSTKNAAPSSAKNDVPEGGNVEAREETYSMPPELKLPEKIALNFCPCGFVQSFYVSDRRVSYAVCREFMEKSNKVIPAGTDDDKSICVSQGFAADFCAYLQRTYGPKLPAGLKFRLPSQREWDRVIELVVNKKIELEDNVMIYSPVLGEDAQDLQGFVHVVVGPSESGAKRK